MVKIMNLIWLIVGVVVIFFSVISLLALLENDQQKSTANTCVQFGAAFLACILFVLIMIYDKLP